MDNNSARSDCDPVCVLCIIGIFRRPSRDTNRPWRQSNSCGFGNFVVCLGFCSWAINVGAPEWSVGQKNTLIRTWLTQHRDFRTSVHLRHLLHASCYIQCCVCSFSEHDNPGCNKIPSRCFGLLTLDKRGRDPCRHVSYFPTRNGHHILCGRFVSWSGHWPDR